MGVRRALKVRRQEPADAVCIKERYIEGASYG
jgi:hypothetical protein